MSRVVGFRCGNFTVSAFHTSQTRMNDTRGTDTQQTDLETGTRKVLFQNIANTTTLLVPLRHVCLMVAAVD
jgi:hypothetical protein